LPALQDQLGMTPAHARFVTSVQIEVNIWKYPTDRVLSTNDNYLLTRRDRD
jgi:hypothetical protein